jgi:hypothetical protein
MKCKFFLALAVVAAALVLGLQPSAHAQFGGPRTNYPGRCFPGPIDPGFGGPGFGGFGGPGFGGFGGPGFGGPGFGGFGGPGFGGFGGPGACGSNNCIWVWDPQFGWVCQPSWGYGGYGSYGTYGSYGRGYAGRYPYRR